LIFSEKNLNMDMQERIENNIRQLKNLRDLIYPKDIDGRRVCNEAIAMIQDLEDLHTKVCNDYCNTMGYINDLSSECDELESALDRFTGGNPEL
jgi:hypothetical protein